MVKLSLLKKALVFGSITLGPVIGFAQSFEYHNASENIGGTWASNVRNVLIGPNAQITVNGDWFITADSVYINPAATITGTGTIHFMGTNTYPGPSANSTKLDGGGVAIGCKVSIENTNTVSLSLIDPAASYPATGIIDNGATAGTNDLRLANNLNFNNTSAHLVLNTFNTVFTSAAAALVTYVDLNTAGFIPDPTPPANAYQAYIVTNGPTAGKVTKEGLANGASFTFPIGQSGPATSPYDYTPITVTNTAGVARNFSVRVMTYANSPVVEGNVTKGMDRTWQVTSDVSGTATIALTHNAANNPAGNSTNGAAYDNTKSYITQDGPSGWSIGSPQPFGGTPVNTLSKSVTVPTSGLTSWFSKTSDTTNSINPVLLISPITILQGASNGSVANVNMTTNLNLLGVIPLNQPYNVAPFNYTGTESVLAIPANVTDWVLVDLRDAANPATIIATRAAFIRSNDTIVDLDGVSPVAFNTAIVPAGSYFISVRHRNHLAIRTPAPVVLVADVPQYYNFTTAQTQAYQDPLKTSFNNAMVQIAGNGKFAMWGGNANNNGAGAGQVNYQGFANDPITVLGDLGGNQAALLAPIYSRSDVNMNGQLNYQGFANDRIAILGFIGGNQATIILQHL